MKTEEKKLKKLLYRSFDEQLSKKNTKKLNEGLKKFPSLMKERNSVLLLRKQLSEKEASFSPTFTTNIMQHIDIHSIQNNILTIKPIFRTVALSGMAAIIIVLISVYYFDGTLSLDAILGINGYNPDMGMLAFF